jgi:ketosteroid isomerase-like protein
LERATARLDFAVDQPGKRKRTSDNMHETNESAVRGLLERWAAAVRAKNMSEILASHSPAFLMFDVPPPFESRGLAAYEDTWRLFYSSQQPVAFDIKWLEVVAGDDVAFAFAHMQCVEPTERVQRTPLDFRLTVGLRKVEGHWIIMHEHIRFLPPEIDPL